MIELIPNWGTIFWICFYGICGLAGCLIYFIVCSHNAKRGVEVNDEPETEQAAADADKEQRYTL